MGKVATCPSRDGAFDSSIAEPMTRPIRTVGLVGDDTRRRSYGFHHGWSHEDIGYVDRNHVDGDDPVARIN